MLLYLQHSADRAFIVYDTNYVAGYALFFAIGITSVAFSKFDVAVYGSIYSLGGFQ